MKNLLIKVLKFIVFIIFNYFLIGLVSIGVSNYWNFKLNDTLFVISLIIFIIELFMNISGNPLGISIQSLGNINSQYVTNVDLKASEHENKNTNYKFRNNINIKNLINSTLLFSSILGIITAHYL